MKLFAHLRHRLLCRVMAAAMMVTSVPPPPAWAAETLSDLPDLRELAVPETLGYLSEVWQPEDGPPQGIVIHIRDLHVHPEAQRHAGELIGALRERYGAELIAVEGASGQCDTTLYSDFPDPPSTGRIARLFLEEGLLTGAEYYGITHPGQVTLWGVEDAPLYDRHLSVYHRNAEDAPPFRETLSQLTPLLEALHEALDPEPLKQLLRAKAQFDASELTFIGYVKQLTALAVEHQISSSAYPALRSLADASAKPDPSALLAEAGALAVVLEERLLTTDEQRQLARITRWHALAQALVESQLQPEEWDQLDTLGRALSAGAVQHFLSEHRDRLGQPLPEQLQSGLSALFDGLPRHEEFYTVAHQRDDAFVRNTLDEMRRRHATAAILVAGGFHTPGITARLRAQRIAYAVIVPAFRSGDTDEALYRARLNNEIPSLQQLITRLDSQALVPPLATAPPAGGGERFDDGRKPTGDQSPRRPEEDSPSAEKHRQTFTRWVGAQAHELLTRVQGGSEKLRQWIADHPRETGLYGIALTAAGTKLVLSVLGTDLPFDDAGTLLAMAPVAAGGMTPESRRLVEAIQETLREEAFDAETAVFVFGSYANGNTHTESDVDLSVPDGADSPLQARRTVRLMASLKDKGYRFDHDPFWFDEGAFLSVLEPRRYIVVRRDGYRFVDRAAERDSGTAPTEDQLRSWMHARTPVRLEWIDLRQKAHASATGYLEQFTTPGGLTGVRFSGSSRDIPVQDIVSAIPAASSVASRRTPGSPTGLTDCSFCGWQPGFGPQDLNPATGQTYGAEADQVIAPHVAAVAAGEKSTPRAMQDSADDLQLGDIPEAVQGRERAEDRQRAATAWADHWRASVADEQVGSPRWDVYEGLAEWLMLEMASSSPDAAQEAAMADFLELLESRFGSSDFVSDRVRSFSAATMERVGTLIQQWDHDREFSSFLLANLFTTVERADLESDDLAGVQWIGRAGSTHRPLMAADRQRWVLALKDLLTNAAQATRSREDRTITLETGMEPGYDVIRITDNGIGIPPEHLPRVFDTDFSTKPIFGGGEGLPSAKTNIEDDGGTIEIQSEAGVGTTVTIRLPAEPSPGAPEMTLTLLREQIESALKESRLAALDLALPWAATAPIPSFEESAMTSEEIGQVEDGLRQDVGGMPEPSTEDRLALLQAAAVGKLRQILELLSEQEVPEARRRFAQYPEREAELIRELEAARARRTTRTEPPLGTSGSPTALGRQFEPPARTPEEDEPLFRVAQYERYLRAQWEATNPAFGNSTSGDLREAAMIALGDGADLSGLDVRAVPGPTSRPLSSVIPSWDWTEVMTNLFVNAMHAMTQSETKRLTIETGMEGGDDVVRVSDTGHGIAPEDLGRVWEPRFTKKAAHLPGTGTGLTIVQGMVKRYGGTITVESEVGKGTTFTMRFPSLPAAPPASLGAAELEQLVLQHAPVIQPALAAVKPLGHELMLDVHDARIDPDLRVVIARTAFPGDGEGPYAVHNLFVINVRDGSVVAVASIPRYGQREIRNPFQITAHVAGEHYMQRAIVLLLVSGHLDAWYSSDTPSPPARAMYERMGREEPRVSVQPTGRGGYRVTRAGATGQAMAIPALGSGAAIGLLVGGLVFGGLLLAAWFKQDLLRYADTKAPPLLRRLMAPVRHLPDLRADATRLSAWLWATPSASAVIRRLIRLDNRLDPWRGWIRITVHGTIVATTAFSVAPALLGAGVGIGLPLAMYVVGALVVGVLPAADYLSEGRAQQKRWPVWRVALTALTIAAGAAARVYISLAPVRLLPRVVRPGAELYQNGRHRAAYALMVSAAFMAGAYHFPAFFLYSVYLDPAAWADLALTVQGVSSALLIKGHWPLPAVPSTGPPDASADAGRGALAELTAGVLPRVGQGAEKVTYGSAHWVVKRKRSLQEIGSRVVWSTIADTIPSSWKEPIKRWISGGKPEPSRMQTDSGAIRSPTRLERLRWIPRLAIWAALFLMPTGWWRGLPRAQLPIAHHEADLRGEALASERLEGSPLIPRRVRFSSTWVRVRNWPWRLRVTVADERVDRTLWQELERLAVEGRTDEVEHWFERVIEHYRDLWRRGLFNTDPGILNNYGLIGDRLVLFDYGRLTDDPEKIRAFFQRDLGDLTHKVAEILTDLLPQAPEVRGRIVRRLREELQPERVEALWPSVQFPGPVPIAEHPWNRAQQQTAYFSHLNRYTNQMRQLRDDWLPRMVARQLARGDRRLRIGVLGPATGEEAASIAATVLDAFEAHPDWGGIETWDVRVTGIERNPDAAAEARRRLTGQSPFAFMPEVPVPAGPPMHAGAPGKARWVQDLLNRHADWVASHVEILEGSAESPEMLSALGGSDVIFVNATLGGLAPEDYERVAAAIRQGAPQAMVVGTRDELFDQLGSAYRIANRPTANFEPSYHVAEPVAPPISRDGASTRGVIEGLVDFDRLADPETAVPAALRPVVARYVEYMFGHVGAAPASPPALELFDSSRSPWVALASEEHWSRLEGRPLFHLREDEVAVMDQAAFDQAAFDADECLSGCDYLALRFATPQRTSFAVVHFSQPEDYRLRGLLLELFRKRPAGSRVQGIMFRKRAGGYTSAVIRQLEREGALTPGAVEDRTYVSRAGAPANALVVPEGLIHIEYRLNPDVRVTAEGLRHEIATEPVASAAFYRFPWVEAADAGPSPAAPPADALPAPLSEEDASQLLAVMSAILTGSDGVTRRHTFNVGGQPYGFELGWGSRSARVGPLLFVMLDELMEPVRDSAEQAHGAPADSQRAAELIARYQRRLGQLYTDHAANIVFVAPSVDVPGESLNEYTAHMVAEMLGRAEAFAGTDVEDAGAGRGFLSVVALRLGARHVTLRDDSAELLAIARLVLQAQGWREGRHFRLAQEDITQPSSAPDDPAHEPTIGLANIGPWPHYGHANHAIMGRWARRPAMRLLFNGGYYFGNAGHEQAAANVIELLESNGFDVHVSADTGESDTAPAVLLIAVQQPTASAPRVVVQGDVVGTSAPGQALRADLEVCLAVAAFHSGTGERVLAHFLPTGHQGISMAEGRSSAEAKGLYLERLLRQVEGPAWQVTVVSSLAPSRHVEPDRWITPEELQGYLIHRRQVERSKITLDTAMSEDAAGKTVILDADGVVRVSEYRAGSPDAAPPTDGAVETTEDALETLKRTERDP